MIRDGPLLTHGLTGGVDHKIKDTSSIAVDTEEHDDRNVQLETVEDKIDSFCRKRKLPHSIRCLSAINKSMISSGKSVIYINYHNSQQRLRGCTNTILRYSHNIHEDFAT